MAAVLNTSAIAGTCAFCVVSVSGERTITPGNKYELVVGATETAAAGYTITAR